MNLLDILLYFLMTPDEYVACVEKDAQKKANDCWDNSWRRTLSYTELKIGDPLYPDRCLCWNHLQHCGDCIPCERCGMRWNPITQPYSVHGHLGDYENLPEVYLAKCITNTWYDHRKILYKPHMYDLLNGTNMLMNETQIYDGLQALQTKYPNIIAWTDYYVLYVAIIARMPRIIELITSWMEKRQSYFGPTGIYNKYSNNYDLENFIGVEITPIAKYGPYKIPLNLSGADWSASTKNASHAATQWCIDVQDSKIDDILARAWASNVHQWLVEECDSFHNTGTRLALGILTHVILPHKIYTTYKVNPYFDEKPLKVIWHTYHSTCKLCDKGLSLYDLNHTPTRFETNVLAKAVIIRRRRLRGIWFCAMKLLGKARLIHYLPGIGSYFKSAETRFNEMVYINGFNGKDLVPA